MSIQFVAGNLHTGEELVGCPIVEGSQSQENKECCNCYTIVSCGTIAEVNMTEEIKTPASPNLLMMYPKIIQRRMPVQAVSNTGNLR